MYPDDDNILDGIYIRVLTGVISSNLSLLSFIVLKPKRIITNRLIIQTIIVPTSWIFAMDDPKNKILNRIDSIRVRRYILDIPRKSDEYVSL
jgi:hypothetical protein